MQTTGKVYDEYTSELLDSEKVAIARQTELDFFKRLNTWSVRLVSECLSKTGRNPIPSRWIDHDKGGGLTVDIRSRFVACETKRVSSIGVGDIAAVFSATPPLDFFSEYSCRCVCPGNL